MLWERGYGDQKKRMCNAIENSGSDAVSKMKVVVKRMSEGRE